MILGQLFKTFKKNPVNKSITILVIDDGEVDQKVACAAVARGGYKALKAYDGATGIAMAQEHRPDLIILDFHLPDCKGPQVCKTLKSNDVTKDIPVLFLTSTDEPMSVLSCYEQGGENYLVKPISPKLLLKQIELTLKDKNLQEN